MNDDRLTLVVQADLVDGGFVAFVAELPGCVSQGDSKVEAMVHLTEALQGVLGLYDAGDEIPGSPSSWRNARGVLADVADEPAEVTIRRIRDNW